MDQPKIGGLSARIPIILLLITVCLLFVRLWLGEAIFWGLPALQFYPWREFAAAELASGRLPLWNPYNGAGAPLLANYQSAIFYPPRWISLIDPNPRWMGWIGMLHLLWAGVGMLILCRRLGAGAFEQGLGALAYPLSGTLITRFGTLPMLDAACWLPWLMLASDGLITTSGRRGRWFALLAGVITLLLLAGHAQWASYSLALSGSYALWRTLSGRYPARRLILWGCALILAAGIAAVQLIPTAQLQRLSQRAGGVDEAFALNFSFSPFSLATLLNPRFFGSPGEGNYFIGGAYFEVAAYIGILPLLGALIGGGMRLWTGLRRRTSAPTQGAGLSVFFGLSALLSFLLALGQYAPFFPFLYRYVPGFKLFQAPSRWLLVTVFSLVVIAALNFPRPGRRIRRYARLGAVLGLGMAGMGWAAARALSGFGAGIAVGTSGMGLLIGVGALLLAIRPLPGAPARLHRRWALIALIVIAFDFGAAGWGHNPTVDPDQFYTVQPPSGRQQRTYIPQGEIDQQMFDRLLPFDDYTQALNQWQAFRDSGLPNLNLLDRRSLLNNFDPLRPSWYERFVELLEDPTLPPDAAQKLAQLAALGDFPRWWVAQRVSHVRDLASAVQWVQTQIRDQAYDPGQTVVIENDSSDLPPGGGTGTVSLIRETPQEIELKVEVDGWAWVVVADTDYPGWEAFLDDSRTVIYRANVAFRAVLVPAGSHTLIMRFSRSGWVYEAGISALSLLIWGLIALVSLRRSALPAPDQSSAA